MRYGQIRKYDVANGKGIRTSIFVTGCTHNCPNCFNKEYQSFTAGKEWTDVETKQVIEYLSLSEVAGLSLLGGEPMENAVGLYEVIREVREVVDKPIWVWSGYTYEEILQDNNKLKLLKECDVLIDGKFVEELKDLTLKFRGSSNQRIINIQESLEKGVVIPYNV